VAALPTLFEETGIGTKSHYGIWIALLQQGPATLRTTAAEACIARLRNGFAFIRTHGQDRIYPGFVHDKIEEIELTPYAMCLRPTLRIGTHNCLSPLDLALRVYAATICMRDVPLGRSAGKNRTNLVSI
jgi:hypothetical protein